MTRTSKMLTARANHPKSLHRRDPIHYEPLIPPLSCGGAVRPHTDTGESGPRLHSVSRETCALNSAYTRISTPKHSPATTQRIRERHRSLPGTFFADHPAGLCPYTRAGHACNSSGLHYSTQGPAQRTGKFPRQLANGQTDPKTRLAPPHERLLPQRPQQPGRGEFPSLGRSTPQHRQPGTCLTGTGTQRG